MKLAAAAGMWLGPMRTFEAAIIGGIIGGALALAVDAALPRRSRNRDIRSGWQVSFRARSCSHA